MRSLAAVFNETVAKLVAASALAGRVRRRRLARAPDAADRAPAPAREPAVEPRPRCGAARGRSPAGSRRRPARAGAGGRRQPRRPARVDATALMRERVEAWLPLADEHGVALVAALDGPLPVRAAPGRLAQVLDNLLANALEASPDGGTVTVSARAESPWVELHLRDEGPGLTPEQRERAFDRFWRAGSGAGGSGLGLAIVQTARRRRRGRGRARARRRAAASTPWSACVLPEPLPKLARALARRLPADAVERRHERKAPHTRTGSRSRCDRPHRRRRHRRARPPARSAGGSRRSGAARTRARHAVVGRGR